MSPSFSRSFACLRSCDCTGQAQHGVTVGLSGRPIGAPRACQAETANSVIMPVARCGMW